MPCSSTTQYSLLIPKSSTINMPTPTRFVHGVTAVDCQKQVRSWSLFRSLMELLIPSCGCHYFEEEEEPIVHNRHSYFSKTIFKPAATGNMIGTIFGHRHGKLSFCIQPSSKTTAPILLLGLEVPTELLAREMQNGVLRIALKCSSGQRKRGSPSSFLLSTPIWTMYCNGKKVGHAIKRRPSQADMDVLRLMQSIYVGVGVLEREALNCDDELMYLRANFEWVPGFSGSESFHLINPDGSAGQELSVFFLSS